MRAFFALLMILGCAGAHAQLRHVSAEGAVTILDGDAPVLRFNLAPVPPPEGVEEHYARSCYVHPLYGLDGEEMTQDFPADHYHHRGVFWAWPEIDIAGRKLDLWACKGGYQKNESWRVMPLDEGAIQLIASNYWHWEGADLPLVREEVVITVRPVQEDTRAVDFDLTFANVCGESVILRGQDDKDKGYGGFNIRPNSTRIPFVYTGIEGRIRGDKLELASPWVDVTSRREKQSRLLSGMTLMQHPGNPGYPHSGWIIRHFGLLGQSWPHRAEFALQTGEPLRLRYRVLLHRRDAEKAQVARHAAEFEARGGF